MVDALNELLTILLAVPVKDRNCACDPIVGCVLYCVLPGGKFLWGMSKWLLKFKTDDLHNCWQVDWCPMSGCYRSSHIKLRRGDSWLPTANSCQCFIWCIPIRDTVEDQFTVYNAYINLVHDDLSEQFAAHPCFGWWVSSFAFLVASLSDSTFACKGMNPTANAEMTGQSASWWGIR